MKFLNTIPVGVALIIFVACTSNEDYVEVPNSSQNIEFSTYIENSTRAINKSVFEDGDVIGLYACQTTGDYTNAYTANFMNNVDVTKSAGNWAYSPLMAWPTDNNEHLSFIAFYPRLNSGGTALTYPFTVNKEPEEQTDPLWCTIKNASINDRNGTEINGNESDAAFEATSGSVPLKFKHMLSKIRFKVKLDGAYPGITAKLNSMRLSSIYSSGTFTVASNLCSGSWESLKTLQNFDILTISEEAKTLSTEEQLLEELLMIPQPLTAVNSTYNRNASIDISYTHTLAEGGEKTINKTIYLPDSWDINKVYNYVVKISLDVNTITVSASVDDWTMPEDEPSISPSTEAAEAVDLGLSVKWASHDFGAASPYVSSPRYNLSSQNMSFVATWGPNWSVPTEDEWKELFSKCTVTQTTVEGVSGYLITGTNGNSIFFKSNSYWSSRSDGYYHYYAVLSSKTMSSTRYSSDYYPIRPVFK